MLKIHNDITLFRSTARLAFRFVDQLTIKKKGLNANG